MKRFAIMAFGSMPPRSKPVSGRPFTSLLFASLLFASLLFLHAPATSAASGGMTLTNVYDAFGKSRTGLTQDFGFATVVEYHGKTILFDAGTNARTLKANAAALHIDLRRVDIAIVSHGHYDHVGGFDALLEANPDVKIYAPADFFSLGAPTRFPFAEPEPGIAANLPKDEQYFHGDRSIKDMVTVPTGRFWKADITHVDSPREILPGVTLIPTTSKLMGTFVRYPPFGDDHPQFIGMPELSVTFATPKGDVLLVGCSHSTIETIVKETIRVRGTGIHLVAGGFHLIPYGGAYIDGLAARMKDEYGIDAVAPAHCTGQSAFVILRTHFGGLYRFFGLGETLAV